MNAVGTQLRDVIGLEMLCLRLMTVIVEAKSGGKSGIPKESTNISLSVENERANAEWHSQT